MLTGVGHRCEEMDCWCGELS